MTCGQKVCVSFIPDHTLVLAVWPVILLIVGNVTRIPLSRGCGIPKQEAHGSGCSAVLCAELLFVVLYH